jgi:hypothetical protein
MSAEGEVAVTAPTRRRIRLAVPTALARMLTTLVSIALFAGGVALGVAAFRSTQPVEVPAADPATAGMAPPAIVREFVAALEADDADALRSAVPTDPYRLLAGELQKWDISTVTSVETLATLAEGERSVTQIVLRGRDPASAPIIINLMVHADGQSIVSFR